MNKIILSGRVSQMPERTVTRNTGMVIATVSVAIDRKMNGKDGTDFFKVKAFKNTAEVISKWKVGDLVEICGQMNCDVYDRNDGTKGKDWYVTAQQVWCLSRNDKKAIEADQEELPF